MIDTTARTIASAQESSRDPHNDVEYVTGFKPGDEGHPSYRARKSGGRGAGRRHSVVGYAVAKRHSKPSLEVELRPLSQEIWQGRERREVILEEPIPQQITPAYFSVRAGLGLAESHGVAIESDSLGTYHRIASPPSSQE